jgi:hypothetical protein
MKVGKLRMNTSPIMLQNMPLPSDDIFGSLEQDVDILRLLAKVH